MPEYQVWTYDDYDKWVKKDCGDLEAAKREIMAAYRIGREPLLTMTVEYDVNIKIKEAKKVEAAKSEAEPDQGPGSKGDGTVRRGDKRAAKKLDKGSGDNSADNSAGN